MSTFFEKYKKLRLEQKIDLNDISNRTKINVKYFEAIEVGNFDILPQPYLRLFIRAYINEIGADPDTAVSELTEYLLKDGTRRTISKSTNNPLSKNEELEQKESDTNLKETIPDENKFRNIKNKDNSSKIGTRRTISPNLIKGILFIAAWVIILIVIRNITLNTDSDENHLQHSNIIDTISNFVDFSQLRTDYVETSSHQNAIEVNPPYIVKIVTNNTVGIVAQKDTLNIESIPITTGNQHTFNYTDNLDLVLNHSNGISAFINGESIGEIKAQDFPIRMTFSTNPNSVSIVNYEPAE